MIKSPCCQCGFIWIDSDDESFEELQCDKCDNCYTLPIEIIRSWDKLKLSFDGEKNIEVN